MTFTFKAALGLGCRTFKSNYGALLGASVVFLLVSAGAEFLQGVIPVPGLGLLTYIFLNGPLWAGMAVLAVLHVRGESPPLQTLFAGFTRYWPLAGISALLLLIVWLLPSSLMLMLAFAISLNWSDPAAATLLVLAIPFIACALFFSVRLLFAPLLCLDPHRQLGIKASFTTAWKLTAPFFWPLLGLLLVVALIATATVMLFVLPFIVIGFPLGIAVMAAGYELITGGENMDGVEEETIPPAMVD